MGTEERTTYVYALSDPDTGRVRYIGVSKNPDKRYYQHTHDLFASDSKTTWIRTLAESGKSPELHILEACSWDVASDCEDKWIKAYSNSGLLLNEKSSGMASRRFQMSETTREKISSALVGRIPTMAGRVHPPEILEKMAEKIRKMTDDEVREARILLSQNNRLSHRQIAGRYEVSEATIRSIAYGGHYGHVTKADGLQDAIDDLTEMRSVTNKIKATDDEVRQIRVWKESGETIRSIMRKTGYSHGMIWAIVNYKRYTWVK